MANTVDINQLLLEIRRYLIAVDLFRVEGCEPRWRPDVWALR